MEGLSHAFQQGMRFPCAGDLLRSVAAELARRALKMGDDNEQGVADTTGADLTDADAVDGGGDDGDEGDGFDDALY